jgi:predicted nucleotidyltransferase
MGDEPAGLPVGASPASRERYALAKRLVDELGELLGDEVAVWGSVARGSADQFSDVEIVTWCEQVPPLDQRRQQLQTVGLQDVVVERDGRGIVARDGGVWVEISWRDRQESESLLERLTAGATTDREDLVTAWSLTHARPLRTAGQLASWQEQLRPYPASLARRLIEEATDFWRFPHRLAATWTLAERGEMFGLTQWVFADVRDVLRALWAFNRRWEPDWKQLRTLADQLQQRPDQLTARIERVLNGADPRQRVRDNWRLIHDTLALISSDHDVTEALASVTLLLDEHPTPRGDNR